MSDFLKIYRNGQILEIVLDRPKANALDAPASREMGEVFAGFRDDPELRVAILTGAGEKFFSGGWDLKAVAEGEEYLGDFGEGGFGGFPEMTDLLKPVICAVNGMAIGAGFEMLLRADFIIAAEHAEFYLPEVRIGVAPDVATFMLPKLLPRQKALEDPHARSAVQCAGSGFIRSRQRGRAGGTVDGSGSCVCRDLLRAAPLSLAAVKEAVHLTENLSFEESYAALRSRSWLAFMKMLESSDSQEGARAFIEKREPEWKGE